MLKKRDLNDVPVLFQLSTHPEVFPYLRHKAYTCDEFYFLTKQIIEAESNRELISRTITDDCGHPIGTINLFDIENNSGFLATWIGQPYFGKGYNKIAKQLFFQELFLHLGIELIFMKVRRTNKRSFHALMKIPYVSLANHSHEEVFSKINQHKNIYDLFVVTKENFLLHEQFIERNIVKDDEEAS